MADESQTVNMIDEFEMKQRDAHRCDAPPTIENLKPHYNRSQPPE
jgi:hypothetical protein